MIANKHPIWVLCLIVILCICGWYFASSKPVVRMDEKKLLDTIDATVTDLKIRQFDKDGVLIHAIESSKMTHIPNQNKNFLTNPYIISLQKDGTKLNIKAQSAISFFGGKEITLKDEVIVERHKDAQTSTLKTSILHYTPKTKYAQTNAPVTLEQNENTINAKGLYAFMDENRIELRGQTRAIYVPHS